MASKTLTIEIGNEFIKVCEAQVNKNNVMVHHAISVQTPQDTVEDGFVKDITQVSEAIGRALTQEQITAKEVTFVLNSSRVATKEVIIPYVKMDKVQELINANASEYFPVNIDDYVLSYTILEAKKTKEEQKMRVLVYAAPERMVESYFNLANLLGMRVKAVDYAGNSTLQLIKIQIDERPTLVVQLGMDTTIVSVMNNNVLQLQRTIPYGESLLLNSVMESRNVKANVALELLASAQIVKNSLEEDETTNSLKYLISNVNRVIEYYSSRNTEAPLQKIVIIGEGADVLGMDVLFSNETSLPAERLTLLKNVESYNRIKLSTSLLKQYMANVGAALNPIHLQPKKSISSKAEKGANVNIVPYVATMVVMLAASVVLAVIPLTRYTVKNNEKKDMKKEIKNLSSVNEIYSEYYNAEDKLADLKAFYLSTCNNTEWVYNLFEFLEKDMPKNMLFNTLAVDSGNVTISGATIYEYELAGVLNSLEQETHISNIVTSGYIHNKDKGTVTFDLSFSIVSDDLAEVETTNGEEAN